jgi:thiamine biosynthesis protein ThiI
MYRVGELVAKQEGAEALVTGESLGQVASQTLANLAVEDQAVSIPILRPLLGMDKVEIEEISREIGTYNISIAPAMCCPVPPKKPATRTSVEEVLEAEEALDINKLLKQATSKIKKVKL